MSDTKFLMELCDANAIAYSEQQVRDILNKRLKDQVDDVFCDGIGSIIFKLNGPKADSPRVMLASHIDEVGWEVVNIDDRGHVMVKPFGAVRPLSEFSQRVVITTTSGAEYKGILNGSFDWEYNSTKNSGKTYRASDFPGKVYVDLGLDSAEEVRKLGISIGDMVTYDSVSEKMAKKGVVCAKAIDDRAGCYVMTKVMENLSKENHDNAVYGVGTSSEEVGVRGAITSVSVVKPDVAIVIDVNNNENEFDRSSENHSLIGKGPIIVYGDRRAIDSKKFIALAHDVCKDLDIAYQDDFFPTGGTDAGAICIADGGIPVITIGVPIRYLHGPWSICQMEDLENAVKLVTELVKRLNADKCADFYKFI